MKERFIPSPGHKMLENRNALIILRYSTDLVTFPYAFTMFTPVFHVAVAKVNDKALYRLDNWSKLK